MRAACVMGGDGECPTYQPCPIGPDAKSFCWSDAAPQACMACTAVATKEKLKTALHSWLSLHHSENFLHPHLPCILTATSQRKLAFPDSPVGATRRGTLTRSCTPTSAKFQNEPWALLPSELSGEAQKGFRPSVAWRCSSIARHLDPHLGGRLQAGAPFLDAVGRADASATCRRLVSQDIVQAAQRCSAASEDQPAMLRASSRPGILTVDVSNARR